MKRPDDVFSVKEIALLADRDPAVVSRAAGRGKLGAPYIVGRRRFYWIAAVEKFYRKKTTQVERDAARNSPALIVGPAAQRRAAEKRVSALLRNRGRVADLVNTIRNFRDVQWKEALTAQGLEFKTPEALNAEN